MDTRRCAHCGGGMEGKKANAVACSVSCNQRILAARRKAEKWDGVDPERPCENCGKSLVGKRPHARYCDRSCKSSASGRRARRDGRVNDQERYLREADRRREYARQYLRDNPERMRAIRRNRKSRIKAQRFDFTERDWGRLVIRYRGCCAYCGAKPIGPLQREHVIPISRGGRHSAGNILPACPKCNMSKKAKLLSEWRYRGKGVTSPSLP